MIIQITSEQIWSLIYGIFWGIIAGLILMIAEGKGKQKTIWLAIMGFLLFVIFFILVILLLGRLL